MARIALVSVPSRSACHDSSVTVDEVVAGHGQGGGDEDVGFAGGLVDARGDAADLGGERLRAAGVEIAYHDARALGDEPAADGRADPAGSTDDDRETVGETHRAIVGPRAPACSPARPRRSRACRRGGRVPPARPRTLRVPNAASGGWTPGSPPCATRSAAIAATVPVRPTTPTPVNPLDLGRSRRRWSPPGRHGRRRRRPASRSRCARRRRCRGLPSM